MKKICLLMIIGILTVVLAAPAIAYQLEPLPGLITNFYASIGVSTEYQTTTYSDDQTDEDTSEFVFNHSSVFGMSAKKGNVFVKWEIGMQNYAGEFDIDTSEESVDHTNTVYARHLYATYAFDETLKLTIGQKFNPSFWYTFTQSRSGYASLGHGALYDRITPQIRLDIGPAYLIAEKTWTNNKAKEVIAGSLDELTDADETIEVKIPKIYVGFDTKIDKHAVGAGVTYNSYGLSYTTAGTAGDLDDENLVSWAAFVHGQVQVTDDIFLKSQVYYAQNASQLGIVGIEDEAGVMVTTDGDKFDNTKTVAGYIFAKADLGTFRPFAGWGYASHDNDQYAKKDTSMEYYVGCEIDVWKAEFANAYIVPEIHVWDRLQDRNGDEEETLTVAGVRWLVSF